MNLKDEIVNANRNNKVTSRSKAQAKALLNKIESGMLQDYFIISDSCPDKIYISDILEYHINQDIDKESNKVIADIKKRIEAKKILEKDPELGFA